MATVVSAYAPTLDSQDDIKEAFYASRDNILSAIPKEDKIILLGDFNAGVGRDHTTWSGTIGKEGVGNINSNGVLLLTKCAEHNLSVTNTLFRQKHKLKTSWMHPRSKHWHLIDYVIVGARDIRDVHLTRAMTSMDGCWTDHRLIRSSMAIRLMPKRRGRKKQCRPTINIKNLETPDTQELLQAALCDSLPPEYPDDIEVHWNLLKSTIPYHWTGSAGS